MFGIRAYQETQAHVESPRANEYRKLGELTAMLLAAHGLQGDARIRARAVLENQQFWSRLRISLQGGSTMPESLRQQLISLSEWVERESLDAAAGGKLESLIAVNQQIMEGLKPHTGAFENDSLLTAKPPY